MQATRAVLTFVKGSTLEAMFSGRHPIATLDNGEYFIDRNPKIFTMVLDYLRNGCRIPPIEDTYKRQSFEMELDYWGIESNKTRKLEQLQQVFHKVHSSVVPPAVVEIW